MENQVARQCRHKPAFLHLDFDVVSVETKSYLLALLTILFYVKTADVLAMNR